MQANQCDLFRSIKPYHLMVRTEFNQRFQIPLDEFSRNLLGSFRIDDDSKIAPRLHGGISCWNEEAQFANIQQLPPVNIEAGTWYFLGAAETMNNATLRDYLENGDSLLFEYDGQKGVVFLSFKLAAGTQLPDGFEYFFDSVPSGRWNIRRNNNEPFESKYMHFLGADYATIPTLVSLGWEFVGIKLIVAASPTRSGPAGNKEIFEVSRLIWAFFDCISTEYLANDATTVLTTLSTAGYASESLEDPIISEAVVRVLEDLKWLFSFDEYFFAIPLIERLNAGGYLFK